MVIYDKSRNVLPLRLVNKKIIIANIKVNVIATSQMNYLFKIQKVSYLENLTPASVYL